MKVDPTNFEYNQVVGMHMAGSEKHIIPQYFSYNVISYDNCREVSLVITGPTEDYGRKGYSKRYSYLIPYSAFDIYGKLIVGKTSSYSFNGDTVRFTECVDLFQPIEDYDDLHFIQTDKLSVKIRDNDIMQPVMIKGRSYRKELVISDYMCFLPWCMESKVILPSFDSSFTIKKNVC